VVGLGCSPPIAVWWRDTNNTGRTEVTIPTANHCRGSTPYKVPCRPSKATGHFYYVSLAMAGFSSIFGIEGRLAARDPVGSSWFR